MKNQKGSVVLVLAIVLAVISILIAYNSSNRTAKVSERARKAQGMNYAHQISSSLARQIRRSYDLAKAETKPAPNSPLCTNSGGTLTAVGALSLCLYNNEICTVHPARASLRICLLPGTSLVAQKNVLSRQGFFAVLLGSHPAHASVYSPPAPLATDASNVLSQGPRCVSGSCHVRCTANADCLTFQFCPMVTGTCSPDEIVTQTIGFPKI